MTPEAPTKEYLLGEALADCQQDLEMERVRHAELWTGPMAVHDVFAMSCAKFTERQRAELIRLLLRSVPSPQIAEIVLASSEKDAALAKQIYNDQKKKNA